MGNEMQLSKLKEPFSPEEVEFRLSQCGETGAGLVWAQCLAYISARAIMDRLDLVCGPENWKVSYEFVGEGVICNLSIKIDDEWVTKQDGAEKTEIESFKGGISSALKRAGSAWGMGRYLYSLETAFATIVEKSPQAYYGKTKTGKQFYWLPPKLPEWALPKKDNTVSRDILNKKLMSLHSGFMASYPLEFKTCLMDRYGVEETKLLDLNQIQDLVGFMEARINEKRKTV